MCFTFFKLLPVTRNRVLYMSHYGKEFSDSPLEIYRSLSNDNKSIEHVIVLNDAYYQSKIQDKNVQFVKFGSMKYYFYCATSKLWIFNVTTSEFMKPRRETFYLQTWHGIPLKKIGNDIIDETLKTEKRRWILSAKYWDMFLSPSKYFDRFFQSAFEIDDRVIRNQGLPREDFFLVNTDEKIKTIKKDLNLLDGKINVLYAPTFRQDGMLGFPYPIDLKKFSENLGNNYRILVKLHPNITANDSYKSDNVIYFKSNTDVNRLLLVSDVLITDYSSLFFDYSLLKNSMVFFAYDLNQYQTSERGFYFDYENFVPGPIVKTQEELESEVKKQGWNTPIYQDRYNYLKSIISSNNNSSTIDLCNFLISEVLVIE
ncbi:hypothetical protein UAS_01608 [Enterococcus asini ATCC 700915]|uniref:CDP-glycerol:poly(Glycerophosphate) glycerophosphotransferase n=2 Tax=Enterococcus TaxID=1350 RepID=R2S0L1_9ENTE|nr:MULTISPECIES: CDP-glycerol glycerophosphotransferase family protein [Enterococcus]EOH86356.1 hypothetical protein UAS_01608 [Enterococcus asini ATCC 700915]EOT57931.1 hypothetical protein I579_01491 [Enterococcus asini ATCC 700915]MDV7859291.1 CDP-glycerol glycerophosphotransferase family protein [Enterococcus faecium]OJG08955.1 hypothetical protein RU94_GL001565 [Enterococcus asini]